MSKMLFSPHTPSGFLTLHVFVSYNNVEYSQNEVILTISNVNQEGRGEDTNGGNGEGKA